MSPPLTWLLDEKGDEAGLSDLRQAIEAIGDAHRTISRQEARRGTPEETLSLHATPMLAYGSIEFVKAIRSDFYPGKWCDWTELRCERYFAKVGDLLLNEDYFLLPAAELWRRREALLAAKGQLFLRPTRADKPFSGATVRTAGEIEQLLVQSEAYDLIVAAPVKEIEAEYRTVVVRGKSVVASSQYRRHNAFSIQSEVPPEAIQVAEIVVNRIGATFPDPMYVVDIVYSDGAYRLLEINGFSYATFYDCNLEAIVRAAHEEALREWSEMQL